MFKTGDVGIGKDVGTGMGVDVGVVRVEERCGIL